MSSKTRSTLIVPAQMRYLGPVMAYARELAHDTGFTPKEVAEVNLALEEVFTNVVKHGLAEEDDAEFSLYFDQTHVGLEIVVKEKGLPYDPNRVRQYSPKDAAIDMEIHGLGTFLMSKAMNEVSFHNLGKGGKEIHLIKYLTKGKIEHQLITAELTMHPLTAASKRETPKFTIRLLQPEEAIEAAKLAYKAYRYSYADYVYYPDRLAKMIDSGNIIAVVAVTEDGKFMGYGDLEFETPSAPVAEFASVFVSPEYRHTRAAYKIMANIHKQASLRLHGAYSYFVTGHTISQKGSALLGGVDCALLLGLLPADLDFQALVGKVPQRESIILSYFSFKEHTHAIVCPPVAHRDIIGKIYQALKHPVELADSKSLPSLTQQGQLKLEQTPDINVATIKVLEYGNNIVDEVYYHLRACCIDKTDAIYLYLNLEDPATPHLSPKFEKMGFFFAGIFPCGLNGKDALILQYLNNIEIDFQSIHIHSALGCQIKDYVQRCVNRLGV